MECWRKFQKSIILLWTDVNYDYVNYVKDVWCKKKQHNNMIMYKKDTVHNVTQLKQYDVQKKHTVHNVSQCKKNNNTMMYKKTCCT